MRSAFFVSVLMMLSGCGGMSDWHGDPGANVCVNGFSPEQHAEVLGALEEWRAKSDGLVTLPVDPTIPCELQIDGVTALESGAVGDRLFNQIRIDVDPADGPESFRIIALHEIGHFLTGSEHSPREEDVMHYRYRASQSGLTDRDAARLFH